MQAVKSQEVHGSSGKDKVEQYKWLITGAPGEQIYLEKTILLIDHAYQRKAKDARVLRLARRWNWLACGVLTVARRDDRYYVIDGQHRLMAALKRSDIDLLPCLVFQSTEIRGEAEAFRDANKERRMITTFEQWNADLVAKDEATIFAHELIIKSGRTPYDVAKPDTVRCLSLVVGAARTNRKELIRVWPLAIQICIGNSLNERVLGAFMHLECNLVDGYSITDKRWREKIVRLGYQGVLGSTQRACAFYARGGQKVWALGLMQELNKGSRVHVLSMRGESE